MIVAIASGKGGTGKTTVAASLAAVWSRPVVAVDLDVEEPNLDLFLAPRIESIEHAWLEIPVPDPVRCTLCGACTELCQFKALGILGGRLVVFPEMCHGCGGCLGICEHQALSSGKRELGSVESGVAGDAHFLMGRLRVGEAMSPPLMREVLRRLFALLGKGPRDAIIDAPPGVSCPAMTAVAESDCIVLVAEPTPFGFHDFALAVEAFTPLCKPMAVVVNRAGLGDDSVEELCRDKGLPVLAHIPFERDIAQRYSRGEVIAHANERLGEIFVSLAASIPALAEERHHA